MLLISKNIFKSPLSFLIGLFFVLCISDVVGQRAFLTASDTLNKPRLNTIRGTGIGGTAVVLGSLSYLWYSEYDAVRFHFFDDSKEWLGMDKIGHGLTSYYGGLYGYQSLKWAGLSEKKSIWYGGMYGWTFLLATEFLDGISSGWGASPSDLLANTLGASIFIGQQLGWKDQRMVLKFSYWPTGYAQYRPNLLGDSHWNRWLKDYNGQTYWLSANLNSFGIKGCLIPKWLNIAIGYSGDGMIGGESNPKFDSDGNPLPYFKRNQEWFLSLDVDFKRIKTRSKILKTILYTASFIKVPFPAIGYSEGKVRFHYFHY